MDRRVVAYVPRGQRTGFAASSVAFARGQNINRWLWWGWYCNTHRLYWPKDPKNKMKAGPQSGVYQRG